MLSLLTIKKDLLILDYVIARRRMTYTTSSLCLAKIIIWKPIFSFLAVIGSG
jgi:hypothetical protein